MLAYGKRMKKWCGVLFLAARVSGFDLEKRKKKRKEAQRNRFLVPV